MTNRSSLWAVSGKLNLPRLYRLYSPKYHPLLNSAPCSCGSHVTGGCGTWRYRRHTSKHPSIQPRHVRVDTHSLSLLSTRAFARWAFETASFEVQVVAPSRCSAHLLFRVQLPLQVREPRHVHEQKAFIDVSDAKPRLHLLVLLRVAANASNILDALAEPGAGTASAIKTRGKRFSRTSTIHAPEWR